MRLFDKPSCAEVVLFIILVFSSTVAVQAAPDWVITSDANTQLVTTFFARYFPELFGGLGVDGLDEEVSQISHEADALALREEKQLLELLRQKLDVEEHSAVAQDLQILLDVLEKDLDKTALEDRLLLPYEDVAEKIFRGLRALLDEQVPAERRTAALVRLRRYAGLEEGYRPLTEQAEAYSRTRFEEKGLLGPYRGEVEHDLARLPRLVEGVGQLFESYGAVDYDEAYETLEKQLAAYGEFVREEILPRARENFQLPPALYAAQLEDLGVDMPVPELTSRAKVAFKEIQNEMQMIAGIVATERGLASSDYRSVLRELKKEQLTEDRILAHYTDRIAKVEAIIEGEKVVTLPERGMRLRLATEAEEAVVQAATIRWPQLLGEAAEIGEIILPVRRISSAEEDDNRLDDFTFEAASWNLVVHEGRPGHELQMASMLERGLSKARAFYAPNSTNIEGWALYAESEMKPYLPLEAQLVSLQHRLLRAARAFLDPMLQTSKIEPEAALRILTHDVVISKPLAQQEIERYTSRKPGQATAYFCGYSRLVELRVEVEILLGEAFDRRAFNDFILGQGLLPLGLIRKALLEEFVASHRRPPAAS